MIRPKVSHLEVTYKIWRYVECDIKHTKHSRLKVQSEVCTQKLFWHFKVHFLFLSYELSFQCQSTTVILWKQHVFWFILTYLIYAVELWWSIGPQQQLFSALSSVLPSWLHPMLSLTVFIPPWLTFRIQCFSVATLPLIFQVFCKDNWKTRVTVFEKIFLGKFPSE